MIEQAIHAMKHSPRHNYVIPGLTSWLIGTNPPGGGCVRLFTMSRDHEEPILPHNHRFDFVCRVLKGWVRNRVWKNTGSGDEYECSEVSYEGILGKHTKYPGEVGRWEYTENVHKEHSEYGMKAGEFHSIYFRKGSEVLFFEGPTIQARSSVLEPVVNGKTIPLFRTDPWMFSTE